MKNEDYGARFALDVKGLGELSATARSNPRQGLRAAAREFEALFMQMLLKSMRDATPQDGLFDSDQTRFYTSMLDQQLGQNLAGKSGNGLARMLEEQLGRSLPGATPAPRGGALRPPLAGPSLQPLPPAGPTPRPSFDRSLQPPAALPLGPVVGPSVGPLPGPPANRPAPLGPRSQAPAIPASAQAENAGPRAFVENVWPHALAASAQTGIPAHFLVGHAALESAWGKSEIRRADGSPSYNLFGIKAGRRWSGDVAEAMTTEYVDGVAQSVRQRFRAYSSYAAAFADYAEFLRTRMSPVLGATDGTVFARQLQQGGYATDPMYADKLSRVLSGSTLRQALQG